AEGDTRPDPAGMTTSAQLQAIGERMHSFAAEQYECYLNDLEPALSQAGLRRVRPAELNDKQAKHVQTLFEQEIFPVLTPLAISLATPAEESKRPTKKKSAKKSVA